MAEMIQRRNSQNGEMEVDLNNGAVPPKGEGQQLKDIIQWKKKQNKTHSRGTAFTTIQELNGMRDANASGRVRGTEKLDQHFLRAVSSDASRQSGKDKWIRVLHRVCSSAAPSS